MLKTPLFVIVSLAVAIVYGVVFKSIYPHVQIDSAFATLFALSGFITAAIVGAAARLIRASAAKAPMKGQKDDDGAAKAPPQPSGDDVSG